MLKINDFPTCRAQNLKFVIPSAALIHFNENICENHGMTIKKY